MSHNKQHKHHHHKPSQYPDQVPFAVGPAQASAAPRRTAQQEVPIGTAQNSNGVYEQRAGAGADIMFGQYMESGEGAILGQIASEYGSKFVGSKWKGSLQSYATFNALKCYFDVNNSYVLNKLRLILFPLRHKSWQRRLQRREDGDAHLPPRSDINAPDLYIPLMASVTYILLVAYIMGNRYQFTPEVLGSQASSCSIALTLEVIAVQVGFYFLSASISWLDLVAYSGYKYVGITVMVLLGFLFGPVVYYLSLVYFGICSGVFVLKTLRLALPDAAGVSGRRGSTRNYFLFACATLQIFLIWMLGHPPSEM